MTRRSWTLLERLGGSSQHSTPAASRTRTLLVIIDRRRRPRRLDTAAFRLRRKISLAIGPFGRGLHALLVDHPRLRELWPEYLIQQHQIIRATVPLTRGGGRAGASAAGRRPARGAARRPTSTSTSTRSLTTTRSCWTTSRSSASIVPPFSRECPRPTVASARRDRSTTGSSTTTRSTFLGYVALMEGSPPTPELIETLIATTGYPREAFRTFVEHAELDPGHRDHLDRTLDSLPLTAEHEAVLASPRPRPPRSPQARSRSCSGAR